jgi:hypothetical protein
MVHSHATNMDHSNMDLGSGRQAEPPEKALSSMIETLAAALLITVHVAVSQKHP